MVVQSAAALPPEREALIRMASALTHRGPDELGIYREPRAGLAHSRLSIIDLEAGQQPMSTADGRLHLAFNGEIFNFIELRAELVEQGHRFRTNSDTEVILHAFEQWGQHAFERFRGQWAVAIWDSHEQQLVLSRDRYGIRPLYVAEHAGRLYFASEVKAIFAAAPSMERALDPRGLVQTFTFWAPLAPQTVFRGVREVRPGHVEVHHHGQVVERRFFEQRYPTRGAEPHFGGSLEDAVSAVREALDRATELRMLRADVTVGCYLSGGLDSSLVAALARRAATGRLRTFSLRFEDAEYDEGRFQQLVARHIESEHEEVVVSRRQIGQVFPEVIRHTERPILRTGPAPLLLLSRLVRDSGIKVVLTGEGADEMFAGYDLFREGSVRRFWARQPDSEMRPLLLQRLYPYLARSPVAQQAMARQFFGKDLHRWEEPGFAHSTRWSSTAALQRLFGAAVRDQTSELDVVAELLESLPPAFHQWHHLAKDQYLEIETLMSSYILSSQGDRMLMASSVEGRFPFLDDEVAELANSLPHHFKLRGLDEKRVLKLAAQELVPAEVLERKKQPYRAPDALSFVGKDAPDWMRDVLGEEAVKDAGVFEPRAVAQLFAKCERRAESGQYSNADNMALVGVVSTQLLSQELVQRLPAADAQAKLTTDVDMGAAPR
jgi:asparagine synthase (glutamine-hydrolysing)